MVGYRRFAAAAALMLTAACVFGGCKKKQEEPVAVTEETTVATTQKEPEESRSATTGKLTDNPVYPILVSMPNDASARPHYGISQADIVYEMHVEGSITRFLAIYGDDLPKRIEPVRSARVYFIDVVEDWMGAFIHFGGAKGKVAWSPYHKFGSSNIKYREDGEAGSKYMTRNKAKNAPNNVIFDIQSYAKTLQNEKATRFPFKFSDEPTSGDTEVKNISIVYSGNNKVGYTYNNSTKTYDRFINGSKFIDANNNNQVSVENIVIQEVQKQDFNSGAGHINLNMYGSGRAYFHIGGKMTEGTWERSGRDTSTVYKDTNGNVIKLAVGQTFVQVVSSDVQVTNS